MAKSKSSILWLDDVEEHDYPAAESYLRLLYDDKRTKKIVKSLRKASQVKDIFRASALSLLGVSNSHVQKDSQKIAVGQALSPILLVRESKLGKVIIADGYHRLCAIYLVDEDALIPCKIV